MQCYNLPHLSCIINKVTNPEVVGGTLVTLLWLHQIATLLCPYIILDPHICILIIFTYPSWRFSGRYRCLIHFWLSTSCSIIREMHHSTLWVTMTTGILWCLLHHLLWHVFLENLFELFFSLFHCFTNSQSFSSCHSFFEKDRPFQMVAYFDEDVSVHPLGVLALAFFLETCVHQESTSLVFDYRNNIKRKICLRYYTYLKKGSFWNSLKAIKTFQWLTDCSRKFTNKLITWLTGQRNHVIPNGRSIIWN